MMSEKKFFPVLYPLNKDLNQLWFIKYQVEDWVNGGFTTKKYTGLLNRLPTVDERLKLAQQYMADIVAGKPLINYQGQRRTPTHLPNVKDVTNVVSCCDKYLRDLTLDGRKPATIIKKKSELKCFYEWLAATGLTNKAIGGITDENAKDYMLYLHADKKLAGDTYNHHKALLAAVWDYYKKKVPYNPWKEIKNKPKRTKHLQSYSNDLRQRIQQKLPTYDPQLWLFMQCIYYCAIRPQSELRLLQVKHINFNRSLFTVPAPISKNGRERVVFIYKGLLQQLADAGYNEAPEDYYIFAHNGQPGPKPVSKNYFARRWNDFRKAFKIDATYKLYGSKHTGGKAVARVTNAYIVQEHMDHTDPKTTQSYIEGLEKEHLSFLVESYPVFAGE